MVYPAVKKLATSENIPQQIVFFDEQKRLVVTKSLSQFWLPFQNSPVGG